MNRLNNRQSARICVLVTVGFAGLSLALPARAGEITLSQDPKATAIEIRAFPTETPLALRFAAGSLDPDATEGLLHAVDDRHRKGGSTIAVCEAGSGGIAVLAFACDACVTLPSTQLEGAALGWCTSASQTEDLADTLVRMGRIDRTLASRLVSVVGALEWSPAVGFITTTDGIQTVALPGKPAAFDSQFLVACKLAAKEYPNVAAAVADIERGAVSPRGGAKVVAVAAEARPVLPPSNPASPPSVPTRGGRLGGTVVPIPVPAVAAASPDPKLARCVMDYRKQLRDMQSELKEFDRYYRLWHDPTHDDFREARHTLYAELGVWTDQVPCLKTSWESKVRVPDNKTRVRLERLQSTIRQGLGSLRTLAKACKRMDPNASNVDAARIASHADALDGLYSAIEKDDAREYDRHAPAVKEFN